MKKYFLDPHKTTAFSFNNVLKKQYDGVSIASSLGPVWVNITQTEFESKTVKPLF